MSTQSLILVKGTLCFPINLTNVIRLPYTNDNKASERTMHKFTKVRSHWSGSRYVTIRCGGEPKLGFLVKQPEEPWFQTEWKFADKAGRI